jgi:hypothetical protein
MRGGYVYLIKYKIINFEKISSKNNKRNTKTYIS